MKEFRIGKFNIGPSAPPFIIAEMSGNHNQDLGRALAIVDAAADTGAHALKLQTYTADTMTLDVNDDLYKVTDPGSLWAGRTLYDLYREAHTPWEWHKPIMERCREKGMVCFSTPFDHTAVDFLEELGVEAYKIASFESTDVRLIKKVAKTGKPMIMSTGMATLAEIDESVRVAKDNGCTDLVLLKCTSSYPAEPTDTNISTIPNMREAFGVQVGLSDHTFGVGVSVASVALGATVIEKHFTLDRSEGGVDSAFSLEPQELKQLVVETNKAWKALGKVTYGGSGENENKSKAFRRSIMFSEDLKAGDKISEENIRCIRPGYGLPPKFFDILIGKSVSCDIKKGRPVSWDVLS